MLAKVPTAPDIAQVEISLIEFSRRFYFLEILGKVNIFNPNVMGSAWIPWLLPMHNVYLCFSAWAFIDFSNSFISFNRISQLF